MGSAFLLSFDPCWESLWASWHPIVSISSVGTLCFIPGREGMTQEVSCLPSEIQAIPGKEAEPARAEEPAELALEGFLGEEAPQPLPSTTQNIPQAFRNFCNLTLLHLISTPSDLAPEYKFIPFLRLFLCPECLLPCLLLLCYSDCFPAVVAKHPPTETSPTAAVQPLVQSHP